MAEGGRRGEMRELPTGRIAGLVFPAPAAAAAPAASTSSDTHSPIPLHCGQQSALRLRSKKTTIPGIEIASRLCLGQAFNLPKMASTSL